MTGDKNTGLNLQHENLLCYAKNTNNVFLEGDEKNFSSYTNPDNDPKGGCRIEEAIKKYF